MAIVGHQTDTASLKYQKDRVHHWDGVARQMDRWTGWGGYYHRRLIEVYRFLVAPDQRVLEIGCGRGDLLAALKPSCGVGIDFSAEMVRRAGGRHPGLRFLQADAHDLGVLQQQFDVILLSDLVNDLWDVQTVLEQIARISTPSTRVILNSYSRLWELPLAVAERLGLGRPTLYQNWLTVEDLANLLNLAGFEVIRHWEEIVFPLPIPLVTPLANRWLARFWPFRHLGLTNFIVARPRAGTAAGRFPEVGAGVSAGPQAGTATGRFPEVGAGVSAGPQAGTATGRFPEVGAGVSAGPQAGTEARPYAPGIPWQSTGEDPRVEEPLVSVIVPARNEAGNIPRIFQRTPQMGRGTELIFVEGHSTDDTYSAIEKAIAAHPEWQCRLYRQTGRGKGDAVRLGFAEARGEILMILDADLTVPPEDLPRFYQVLRSGKGDFANGVRLVYPMEKQAMRFINLLGNKFFSLTFSWLLGQPVKDTLCGTKVLWKADYQRIAANRSYFGDFDPFGDFDLLFGAARLNLKIVDLPIRYRERTYGTTNIQRWRHGLLLLRMVQFAARRLKFI